MKNNKWSQKGLKIDDVALNGAFWTQKNYGVQIRSIKWNPFVTDEFHVKPWYFEWDCPFCTRSASSFCLKPLYFLAHAMWVKWWHHANFQPFQSSFVGFSISGSYSWKKSVNAWKITNEVRNGWKLMMWLWMVHFEHRKSMEFK